MSLSRRFTYGMAVLSAFILQVPAYAEGEQPAPAAAPETTTSSDSSMHSVVSRVMSDDLKRYVGILGSYTDTDSDRKPVKYGAGMHLYVGEEYNDKWNFEISLDHSILETGKGHGSDWYEWQVGIDALYFLKRNPDGFSLFVLGGLGPVYDDTTGKDKTGGFANLGVGFLSKPLNDYGVAIRGEARYIHDFNYSGLDDIRVSLGVQIPLNKPGTNVVTQINNTDSDGDGVIDGVDRCPGTLHGLKVDQYGCAIAQTLVLKGVSFDFDSTRLGVNAQTILDEVVTSMKGQPSMKVEIAGHTDNYGSDTYNKDLSQRRADAVREYLEGKGIPASSLHSTGYGESQPIASNDTDFGREQNRRVEFRIESQ